MCEGFGGTISIDGRVLFAEPDRNGNCSHSMQLERLGWRDSDDAFLRSFVRFEFADWTEASFRYDENGTLPVWVVPEYEERAKLLLARVAPIWAEYVQVTTAALAEYVQVKAEYVQLKAAAWAEYVQVTTAAWAEYVQVTPAARAEMIAKLALIEGYVPEKEENVSGGEVC